MAVSDVYNISQRIFDLEKRIHKLEQESYSQKIAIDSLMRTCETLGTRLTEEREEFVMRERKLAKQLKKSRRETDKS